MIPLRVTARTRGGIALPSGALALDALLASAVAMRDALPPVSVGGVTPIEIPVQREPAGRFHLASFAMVRFDGFDLRWVNRRFPLPEAQALAGPRLKRIQISTGPCKSFRIPMESGHPAGDLLEWWCLGEEEPIRALLALVTHLGKRRGVGSGQVAEWTVKRCDSWGDGFPVVRDGRALRPLPLDWPGLVAPTAGYRCLTYPYWERTREEMVAVPEAER